MAGLVGALLLAGAVFVTLYKTTDIPNPNKDFQTQTSFVYYADGKTELGKFATQNRESITLKEMPQNMQDAVVAAENRTFWTDKGIDPKGILRAAFSNARGNSTQGASTITQQYVKILYLTQERSLQRKVKEAILSLKIQNQLSKSQILEGYLNTIYFGRGAYGVQAAAQAYFDNDAKDLTLQQAPCWPACSTTRRSSTRPTARTNKQALKERYRYVLDGMAEQGTISARPRPSKAARQLPVFPKIEAQSQYGGQKGHMLALVRDELHQLGFSDEQIDGEGLRVTTTFTPKAMQAAAAGRARGPPRRLQRQEAAHRGRQRRAGHRRAARLLRRPGLPPVADQLGGDRRHAPGSTFKPFALADRARRTASRSRTPSTATRPTTSTSRAPATGCATRAPAPTASATTTAPRSTLTTATEESINTAYADLTQAIPDGRSRSSTPPTPSASRRGSARRRTPTTTSTTAPASSRSRGIALGSATIAPINMANAYATIANGGQRADVHVIDKVVDRNGETLWSYKQADQGRHRQGRRRRHLLRPAAGRPATAPARRRWRSAGRRPARPAPRPTARTRSPRRGSSATPRSSSTAVMYVRGDGNEQLDGWLPSYFGADYPAETWTAVMRRDMEGVAGRGVPAAGLRRRHRARQRATTPYTPPPSPDGHAVADARRRPTRARQPVADEEADPGRRPRQRAAAAAQLVGARRPRRRPTDVRAADGPALARQQPAVDRRTRERQRQGGAGGNGTRQRRQRRVRPGFYDRRWGYSA